MADLPGRRKVFVQRLRKLADQCGAPQAKVRDDARKDKVGGMAAAIRDSAGPEEQKAEAKRVHAEYEETWPQTGAPEEARSGAQPATGTQQGQARVPFRLSFLQEGARKFVFN